MKEEKYKGLPICHWNERRTAFVVYNRFDMGCKYKVYSVRENDDGSTYKHYEIAFDSFTKAYNYADKVC